MKLKIHGQSHTIVCTLFILIALLFTTATVHGKTTIRFATLAPEGSTWMKYIRALDNELRSATGGEVEFKLYPNMAMGDEKDVIRKIRMGQVNGGGLTGVGLGEILPELRMFELPYLFDSEEEIDFVTGEMTEYFRQQLAAKGFILLGWADVGWVYFLGNKPVAEPSQLAGAKVWMWEGDPLAEAFFAELKKAPIPLPITDVHLSLQTGLIDAVYCSPLAALAMQWYTKTEYISDIPFTNAIGAVLIDKKTFDKIPANHQQTLITLSSKHLRELLIQSRKDNREAYEVMIRQGLRKVASTPAQRQEMRAIGERVHNRLKDKLYSGELLTRAKGLVQQYRTNNKAGTK